MPPPRPFVVTAQMKMTQNNGEAGSGGGIHLVPLRGLSTQQGPSTDSPMGRAGAREAAATES